MVKNGDVETLITGHDHRIFIGSEIITQLDHILHAHTYFKETVLEIVSEFRKGITVNNIYSILRSKKDHPALQKYFSLEFPKMPPMLKTVITSLLLEEGCSFNGPDGNVLFYRK